MQKGRMERPSPRRDCGVAPSETATSWFSLVRGTLSNVHRTVRFTLGGSTIKVPPPSFSEGTAPGLELQGIPAPWFIHVSFFDSGEEGRPSPWEQSAKANAWRGGPVEHVFFGGGPAFKPPPKFKEKTPHPGEASREGRSGNPPPTLLLLSDQSGLGPEEPGPLGTKVGKREKTKKNEKCQSRASGLSFSRFWSGRRPVTVGRARESRCSEGGPVEESARVFWRAPAFKHHPNSKKRHQILGGGLEPPLPSPPGALSALLHPFRVTVTVPVHVPISVCSFSHWAKTFVTPLAPGPKHITNITEDFATHA